ncbi:M3 family metallopeptidase, partial [Methylobacterium organophilum]|nr:M3 family metallopeptidase [Methylobacterium organophilum]
MSDAADAGLPSLPQDNPFREARWSTPHGLPPFDRIRPEHYGPAFEAAIAAHDSEIRAIAGQTAPATFANTVAAMERAGLALERVAGVFYNLTGSHTNPELQAIEREIGPKLARHGSAIYLNPELWARISAIDAGGLGAEERRVLDRYRIRFRRSGADLGPEDKARIAEIAARMSELGTTFSQNLLADESSFILPLQGEEDLAGLPPFLRAATESAARERGLDGHVVTLSRSLIEPFLVCSTRRDLRERAYAAWTRRGENGGATDNRAIIAEIIRLRAERARLLGFESFAHFALDDTMAASPDAATGLLRDVWTPARARAAEERDRLQATIQAEGHNFALQAHDWRHYAEKVRRAEHDLDESEIKAYLPLERMIQAAFDTAARLFGLTFTELSDVPRYHPDVRVWRVGNPDGSEVGLFLGDYFARASKRSGAWMSAFRSQERLNGPITPIIVNVMNFAKAPDGEATLLSFDDARTLFHEFGHALHGLLSDVSYPLLSGTAVSRDFVELPSQLYEHWLEGKSHSAEPPGQRITLLRDADGDGVAEQ